jgi:dipeptidyl aminopeptidase/acylaminoacyl peptidase
MQAVVLSLALPLPSTASPLVTALTGAYAQLSPATPPEGESTFIPITSRGAPEAPLTLRLEAILYRPNHTDKFPVVIFNHGSTGMGAIPTKMSFRYAVQAHYFLSRGYAVVVPMRKGRYEWKEKTRRSASIRCDAMPGRVPSENG